MPSDSQHPFDREPLRCLVGPTASGKTAFALEIAEAAGAEILSLDSMLVYRGMDVGTAKPSAAERARVPHHLIDRVSPAERYDVQAWLRDAAEALADILGRGRRALFVGGTGFYLAALLRGLFEGPEVDLELRARIEERFDREGAAALHAELVELDPPSAARIHPNDRKRLVRALEVLRQTGVPLSTWQREWSGPAQRVERARLVGLRLGREELDDRIRRRCLAMLDAGWGTEVERLVASGGLGPSAVQALGYAEVLAWTRGELTRDEAVERIAQRTRRFSRRQETWYRKFDIQWLPAENPSVSDALAALGW